MKHKTVRQAILDIGLIRQDLPEKGSAKHH